MKQEQGLTALEYAVIKKFLETDDPVVAKLSRQLETATVTKREFTGVGFFTCLSVAVDETNKADNRSFQWTGVAADIPNLENGAGFVLFVEDGTLNLLEGSTYGDDVWPDQITSFTLRCL